MERSASWKPKVLAVLVLLGLLTIVLTPVHASPLSRQKRVSDQRLAELETLLALAKMKGKLVTVPIGFGVVDPAKIGRRRRSSDSGLEKLRRILRAAAQHPDLGPAPWETSEARHGSNAAF